MILCQKIELWLERKIKMSSNDPSDWTRHDFLLVVLILGSGLFVLILVAALLVRLTVRC